MKREKIGEKEINISHDLSGKLNVRKEKRDLHEIRFKSIIIFNVKTA